MPGTAVAGVDVGGLSRTEARARIVHDLGDRLSAPVTVRVGDTTADVVPSELGIRLDADRHGRPRIQRRPASRPGCCRTCRSESIEPVLLYPKKLTLPKELATLEQKPRNAKPVVQDDGTVGVVPAEDGLVYDDAAPLRAIALAALRRDGAITLSPAVSEAGHLRPRPRPRATAADAKRLLAKPISLTYHGKKIGQITPQELAPLLKVKRARHRVRARASHRSGCATRSPKDAEDVSRPPVDAHWKTDGAKARVVKHKNGRGIDGEQDRRRRCWPRC